MSSAVDEENLNENMENWKAKTQSMYDLQRERSLETIKATAVAINNLGVLEKKEGDKDCNITNENELEQTKKRRYKNNVLFFIKYNTVESLYKRHVGTEENVSYYICL